MYFALTLRCSGLLMIKPLLRLAKVLTRWKMFILSCVKVVSNIAHDKTSSEVGTGAILRLAQVVF